jgi:hypothetical protein
MILWFGHLVADNGIQVGRKQVQFPKLCVFLYLEFRKVDKVQKQSNSEWYTPSSESFSLYNDRWLLDTWAIEMHFIPP